MSEYVNWHIQTDCGFGARLWCWSLLQTIGTIVRDVLVIANIYRFYNWGAFRATIYSAWNILFCVKINPGIFQQTKYYRAAGTSNREESDLKAEKIKSIIDVRQAEVTPARQAINHDVM